MDFEVIGPAAASPGKYGPCSSYLVRSDRAAVLLDCGPGAVAEFVRRHGLSEITGVVLSHMHADHALDVYTLSKAILARQRLDGRAPIRPRLFLPPGGAEVLLDVAAAFSPITPGVWGAPFAEAYDLIEYDPARAVHIEDMTLTFVGPTNHPAPCWAIRAAAGGETLAFSADSAWDEVLVRVARDADVFLCEATYGIGDPRHIHLTAGEAARAAQAAGARRLVLTHHRLPDDEEMDRLRRYVAAIVPCPVDVAVSGLGGPVGAAVGVR
ncbi:MAG TPA: MBL fold metallo-hydrolase [bacterium]|nr:MBL fold metallo-hydrolase [bacterium]